MTTGTCETCHRKDRVVGPFTCSKTGATWKAMCTRCMVEVTFADPDRKAKIERIARAMNEALRQVTVTQTPRSRMVM